MSEQKSSVVGMPDSWCFASVEEVIERCQYGSSAKTSEDSAGVPVLRMGNIQEGRLDLTALKYLPADHDEFPTLLLQEGDLLFNRTNSAELVGKSAVYFGLPAQCSYASYLVALRLGAACDPKYLCFCLNSHHGKLWIRSVVSQQVGQANVNSTKLRAFRFPLAPRNEQARIVAKIEELFSDLDAGVSALKRAKANLKRYRAVVLKAAIEGKLTEEWRAKHPPKEPASTFLARILKERRQKWEADHLAKFAAAEKEPPKNWREKYVEPTSLQITGLPPIPDSWTWATLDAIADVAGGITKDQKKANQPGMREVPYLRVANVQRGFLDLSEMKSISASEDDISELRLEPGDVLFTEGGDRDKLGRGWVWSSELSECIHQNHIFRGRLLSQDLQPRLVSHHGNTFGKGWFIKAGKQTTNLASINLGILRRFPVPIPPAAEQAEIIAQVDEKLSQIDAAETQIEHALLRAARLRQSILTQAFGGELVLQDPKDEPASVLLERLRVSRSAHEGNGKVATPTRSGGRRAKSKQVEGADE
jgi:type I restriction enzyme, S subunit